MEAVREIRRIDQAQVTFDLPQIFWGQLVEIIILPLPPSISPPTSKRRVVLPKHQCGKVIGSLRREEFYTDAR